MLDSSDNAVERGLGTRLAQKYSKHHLGLGLAVAPSIAPPLPHRE